MTIPGAQFPASTRNRALSCKVEKLSSRRSGKLDALEMSARGVTDPKGAEELGPVRAFVASIGALFIACLIRVFGRTVREEDAAWLLGPFGSDYIGDKPYEECAVREGLSVIRRATEGGLISDFDALTGPGFDASRVHAAVRCFYEQTARFRMDVWAETFFPANIGLFLLVTTISRKVNQLNFPLKVLETARGMESEIVLLNESSGHTRYAGWYRRLVEKNRVIYTGFYMTSRVPLSERPCVKVVFPMPRGNATVILRPSVDEAGGFELSSEGTGFGDVGFYRVQTIGDGKLRVWRVRTLKEHFRVYVDDHGTLRCDHRVSFLGLPVLHLHYRIEAARQAHDSRDVELAQAL